MARMLARSLDTYSRRARLEPALLTVLPVGLAVIAWFPSALTSWGVFLGILTSAGGTALLSQVARDRGKKKEVELFQSWGGKPTTVRLRHRDCHNAVLLGRRHQKLQKLLASKIPNSAEEAENSAHADAVYDSCVARLIEKTRDRKKFPLVFDENCSYGFRRNLWGMKPIGVLLAMLGLLASIARLSLDYYQHTSPTPFSIAAAAVNLVLLLGWTLWFTPGWVRIAADAYAERLLASLETL